MVLGASGEGPRRGQQPSYDRKPSGREGSPATPRSLQARSKRAREAPAPFARNVPCGVESLLSLSAVPAERSLKNVQRVHFRQQMEANLSLWFSET